MSRIGHVPVEIPEGVELSLENNTLTVKGAKAELTEKISSRMELEIEEDQVTVVRPTDSKADRSLHGLTRSMIINMIEGVTKGFKKELEMLLLLQMMK